MRDALRIEEVIFQTHLIFPPVQIQRDSGNQSKMCDRNRIVPGFAGVHKIKCFGGTIGLFCRSIFVKYGKAINQAGCLPADLLCLFFGMIRHMDKQVLGN